MKKALFPGTFDPFTIGHESIVKRGLDLVDEIVIAIGVNDAKSTYFSLQERIEMISKLYEKETRISVASYQSLTVDFAKEVNAQFILRGVRSSIDFEYERTIADMNRHISGVETLVLFTEPELAYISSSVVRELLKHKQDILKFVPKGLDIKTK